MLSSRSYNKRIYLAAFYLLLSRAHFIASSGNLKYNIFYEYYHSTTKVKERLEGGALYSKEKETYTHNPEHKV